MDEQEFILLEDDLYRDTSIREASRHFVVFALENEWYGFDIHEVKEVLSCPPIALLPNVPAHIAGIVNIRGNILSVNNLKTFFSLSNAPLEGKEKLIVIQKGEIQSAFLVDGPEFSVEIPVSKIEAPLSNFSDEKWEFIEGQVSWEDKLIAILKGDFLIDKTRLSNP